MADVFISYSKKDRFAVEQLAAFVESVGYSCWWDRSLSPGDSYRDEIVREIDQSRVVIVVWSKNSIESEWVRAEAARARAQSKLVPLRVGLLDYAKLPMPFGEMHTDPIESHDAIAASLRAYFVVSPASSGLWTDVAYLKYVALTWFGIIGTAVSVFSGLREVYALSSFVRVFVIYWHDWLHVIWVWVFALFYIEVPRPFTAILNFICFGIALAVGAKRSEQHRVGAILDRETLGSDWKKAYIVVRWLLLVPFALPIILLGCVNANKLAGEGSPKILDSNLFINFMMALFGACLILFFIRLFLLPAWHSGEQRLRVRNFMMLLVPFMFSVMLQPTMRWSEVSSLHSQISNKLQNKLSREELLKIKSEIDRVLISGKEKNLISLRGRVDQRLDALNRTCYFPVFSCTEVPTWDSLGHALAAPVRYAIDSIFPFRFLPDVEGLGGIFFFISYGLVSFVLIGVFVAVIPFVSPVEAVNNRLIHSLSLVLVLVIFNELSKLAGK